MNSLIDETEQQIQQDSIICCICLEQKKKNSIIGYKCRSCKEGNLCDDCALKLFTMNTKSKCPVCRNETKGKTTWYLPYDIEMGYIHPTEIHNNINNNIINDDETSDQNNFCNKLYMNKCTILLLVILLLFISFIVGTIYKSLVNRCAWKCDKYESMPLTISTSILFGWIIVSLLLPLFICVVNVFIKAIYKTTKFIAKKCIQKFIFYTRQENIENTKEICKAICKSLAVVILGAGVSFCIGTLYFVYNNICYWNCENNDNSYTVSLSIIIGGFILLFIILSLGIIKACFTCVYVICNKLTFSNSS